MQWTAEIDTERGPEEISISTECYGGRWLVDKPRRAMLDGLWYWFNYGACDQAIRNRRPKAIASNMVAKDIEGT